MSEQKEEGSFLIAIAVLCFNIFNEVVDIISAVDELSGDRLTLAFIHEVAVNVAYIGDACHNACSVAVAETALDMIFFIEIGLYNGIIFKVLA